MSIPKLDLTLINSLVQELNAQVAKAEKLGSINSEYMVEISKASGLLTGIMTESTLLITDITKQARLYGTAPSSDAMKDLEDLLGSFGKKKTNNNIQ